VLTETFFCGSIFAKGDMNMIKDRIKEIRTTLSPKLSQTEFGEKLGMSRSEIANLEGGRVDPTPAVINLICMTFDIEPLWLKDGIGEMKKAPADDDELVDRIMAGENEFAKSVMKAFAKLDDSEWEKLRELVDALKKAGL
jgi:transcriptional regulator with XRE-family HTH domain